MHKATPWITRLLMAEPNNPEGLYLKAWALMAGSDRPGAIKALRQAAALNERREPYLSGRIITVREAALACGFTPGDAARLGIAPYLKNRTRSPALNSAIYAINLEKGEAKTPGGEDRLMDITGIGLITVEKFSRGGGVSLVDAISCANLETNLLTGVPDDTEIGEGGRKAMGLAAEAIQRLENVEKMFAFYDSVPSLLRAASDDVVITYVNCFQGHGEQEALAWLLTQTAADK